MPIPVPVQISSAINILGTVQGNTQIPVELPTDAAQNLFPTHILIAARDVDSVVTPPTVSVGTNSPNFDNLLPATLMSGITTWPRHAIFAVPVNAQTFVTGTTVFARVSVVANAVAWRFNVYLLSLQLKVTT